MRVMVMMITIILTAALCLYELLYPLLLTRIGRSRSARRVIGVTSLALQRATLDILDGCLLMLGVELSVHRRWRDHSHVLLGDQIGEVGPHQAVCSCGAASTDC